MKFSHMFDVAFTVISDEVDGYRVPMSVLIEALKARVTALEAMSDEEVSEAFGLCDTYEIEDPDDEEIALRLGEVSVFKLIGY